MIYEPLAPLLQAIDIVVFERRGDGSFARLTPPPPWFWRLATDTFPFLGHILEEATAFWASRQSGAREWGPCVDTDESAAAVGMPLEVSRPSMSPIVARPGAPIIAAIATDPRVS